MAIDFSGLIQDIEAQIRQARGIEARARLKALNAARIPRQHRLPIANLARRVGLFSVAIRILNPLVRSEKSLVRASDPEKAEYAVSLLNIGATLEAEELLGEIRSREVPELLLYKSFARFSSWDYGSTLPWLRDYVAQMRGQEYKRLVGLVNLAAALIAQGEYAEAQLYLAELMGSTDKPEYRLLHGNSLELSAQAAFGADDLDRATRHIEDASRFLRQSGHVDNIYVQKWRAILAFRRKPRAGATRQEMLRVRAAAADHFNWETVRECDLYLALYGKDETLFQRVYFGSPHPGYRRMMLHKMPPAWHLPDDYVLGPPVGAGRVFDVEAGAERGGPLRMNAGKLLHRGLVTLARDFYRPQMVGTLFSQVFPGQYFDPNSSPDRVYQMMRRLRAWLRQRRVPLAIDEIRGTYTLRLKGDFGLLFKREPGATDGESLALRRLTELFGGRAFTAVEACEALRFSRMSFSRWSRWAEERDRLVREGGGRHVRYRIIVAKAS